MSVRPRYARKVGSSHNSLQHVSTNSCWISIGTTCKTNWLELAVLVACRTSQAFVASHFLQCWANDLWATETYRTHFASSCALQ